MVGGWFVYEKDTPWAEDVFQGEGRLREAGGPEKETQTCYQVVQNKACPAFEYRTYVKASSLQMLEA